MTFISNLNKEKKDLEARIAGLKEKISKAPGGTLYAYKRGSVFEYYYKSGENPNDKPVYVHHKDLKNYTEIARRMYDTELVKDLEKELDIVNKTICLHTAEKSADNFLKKHVGIGQLILPTFSNRSEVFLQWKNTPYKRNMKHPENIKHKTIVEGLPHLQPRDCPDTTFRKIGSQSQKDSPYMNKP